MWPFDKPKPIVLPKPAPPAPQIPPSVTPSQPSTAYATITDIRTAEDLGQGVVFTKGLVFAVNGRIVNADGTAHGSGINDIFVNTQFGASRSEVYKAIVAAIEAKYPGTSVIMV